MHYADVRIRMYVYSTLFRFWGTCLPHPLLCPLNRAERWTDDTKMFVREVDELLNVIGFVEIGRY